MIGEYTGELISHDELEYRSQQKRENFQLIFHHHVQHDSGRRWETRFMNHSCAENRRKVVEDKTGRVLIVADKGIGEEKEIFINYGQNYFQGMKCLCDQDGCFEKK